MSTREQHTLTIYTSAVRNTRGRSGPQGLEEPTSDEVLRELCNKNYHQLLPLIAEKMQKEKEQQDKLNAVKARLLYGNETGKNQRNHKESHYFESKTPTARTEPKRRHGNRRSRSSSPVASVFKDSNKTDLLHLGLGRGRRVVCLIGARRPEKRADIRRLKTVREVIGSPNQEDTVSKPQQEDLLTGL
ncbi:hypothetical protein Tco_1370166 [Tanacetum coccineum]